MTDYLTLTEFVPGTKAKAQEVNANFSALKDAVNSKAALAGDSTRTFSVANATSDSHAVNKGQTDDLYDDLIAEIKKTTTKFCVKSGYTTSGVGDLLSYSILQITPKIGGTYGNLVISNYAGVQTTITSSAAISMSAKTDGDYNIFIKSDGTIYTLNNTIYKQAARPTMKDGDIWLNTSLEKFSCIKYDGTNDTEFLDVPIGKVTLLNSAITSLKTFAFNQNDYSVNSQTTLIAKSNLGASIANMFTPDYKNGVSKSWATQYTAESNGFLFIYAGNSSSSNYVTINGKTLQIAGGSGAAESSSASFILAAGDIYTTSGPYGNLTFFPMKNI